jgi:UDP-N-acetylmuramyl pentapeptide synthase
MLRRKKMDRVKAVIGVSVVSFSQDNARNVKWQNIKADDGREYHRGKSKQESTELHSGLLTRHQIRGCNMMATGDATVAIAAPT